MLNLAVFVSGRGSNFRAVSAAIESGRINATIRLVISSKADAPAADFAREHGMPVHTASGDGAAPEAIMSALSTHHVNFIALCGYMKLVPEDVVRTYRNRIINIHPALLPAFGGKGMYGMNVHTAVLASGARVSGATVHIVSEEYDKGPIVLQRTVEVLDDDTPETLAARVLQVEHAILPEALALFSQDRIIIRQQRTIHLPAHP